MAFDQSNRNLQVGTPFGDNVLLLTSLDATERISQPFEFRLDFLSEDASLDFDQVVGEPLSVTLKTKDGDRYFHGRVRAFTQEGMTHGLSHYHAEVVPWFWMLSQTADCRIFQNLSVPDIVSQVFDDLGFTDYRWSLEGSYDQRVYCTQYRETALDFVSRLLQEEGIHYFFDHEDTVHTMVLADSPASNKECPGQSQARLNVEGEGVEGVILSLSRRQLVHTTKVRLTDYNFETPRTDLGAERESSGATQDLEVYDYPGKYPELGPGERHAKLRLEGHEATRIFVEGTGTCRSFVPGFSFQLRDHPRDDVNTRYLLLGVDHHASEDYQAGGKATPFAYQSRFRAMPADVPYRPGHPTNKPTVNGSQTAVIVGPAGEEIYTDKFGRVKVQFHWDRKGKRDENSSCWIRVAQNWAGKNWGAFFLPRIGQEVIVDFLEGDPDCPIITGRVYNAEQMPPYALPANMTQSTLKTRSCKGGSPANFNEIRFEDKMGSEELYVHAEKDHNQVTENDRSEQVGHDRSLSVGNDKSESVGNDKTVDVAANLTETVGVDETLMVSGNRTRNVSQNETVTVDITRTRTIGVNDMINVGAAQEITVGGAQAITVGAVQAITVGRSQAITVGTSQAITVGTSQTTRVGGDQSQKVGGDRTISVDKNQTETVTKNHTLKAKKILIEAEDEILIKTGKASIQMKKNGDISISGKTINVEGSGNIVMKAKKILQN